ncbi:MULTISPECIES: GGDEF domain-containing protein [unclassified Thalassospira]|uniref:GGDEF domain-containing protein n=1 Tax=unclassified Thalassospira TaxID=2648997 RepID=UPI001FEDCC91|nr:GGDEF domain-containing protein [Thalassospira sp. MCCC 1A01428]
MTLRSDNTTVPMSTPAHRLVPRDWPHIIETIDFAFQPIISTHTGRVFGYEALLRNWAEAGFTSIQDVFDTAWETGVLHSVDMQFRAVAINKFARLPGAGKLKLFYNFDSRVVRTTDYRPGQTVELLTAAGLEPDAICLEISERHDISHAHNFQDILLRYRAQGFKVAIDDYGSGFAQMRALYECEPDIIKIDRFFIDGMDKDRRKELFVTQITGFSHLIGAQVVAEGVETLEELMCCRRIGCDFIQGFFVAKPSVILPERTDIIPEIADVLNRHRRQGDHDGELLRSFMIEAQAVPDTIKPNDILDFFQKNADSTIVPVINRRDEPVGIIRDSDFKAFIYTPFGRELLQNPSNRAYMSRFLRRCPSADIRTSLSELLETFVTADTLDGLILTEDGRYLGVLDQRALLRAVNERNTLNARDENPLTRLPGNSAIYRYAANALSHPRRRRFAVYFDFDNFKPFNDRYGFRQGDRAILLFKDILGKALSQNAWFIGHIGGDDFFAYVQSIDFEEAVSAVRRAQAMFDEEIKSFYDPKTRENGFLQGKGRDGIDKHFPLMTVSAALIRVPPERTDITLDHISTEAAKLKDLAKNSPDRFASSIYENDDSDNEINPASETNETS